MGRLPGSFRDHLVGRELTFLSDAAGFAAPLRAMHAGDFMRSLHQMPAGTPAHFPLLIIILDHEPT